MCVFIVDMDGRIKSAGSDAACFTGSDDMTGRHFVDCVTPPFSGLCQDAIDTARAGATQVVEVRALHEPATRWSAAFSPLADEHAGAIAASILRLPSRAVQNDQLIAGAVRAIAHDLNNTLTVVVGLNGLMASGDEERRELYISEIGKAAEKATQLTAELLSFGRRPGHEVGVLGVNALLLEIEPLLRRLLPGSFDLIISISDRVDPVRMDRGVIEFMIIDLVVHIIQSMNDGGRLSLRTYAHTSAAGTYTVLETCAEGNAAEQLTIPASVRAAAIDCGAEASLESQGRTATVLFTIAAADPAGYRESSA